MKLVPVYILIGLLILAEVSVAQAFTTKVSSTIIGKNDVVEVQYIAENLELSDFILPKFPGWQIQSGPNFSSNRVQSGNVVKQQIIYSVTLQPSRTGKISVPSATISIDQHNSRQSNTVTVEVRNVDHLPGNQQNKIGSQQGLMLEEVFGEEDFSKDQVLKEGENPLSKIKNNLSIRLELSKPSCYVGEPIIATYKLCTRLRSQSRVVKQPEFSGCTVTELTAEQSAPTREKINGKLYNVYIIRRVQLIPLQEGELPLPVASVSNNVTFYKAGDLNYRDIFYNRPSPSVIEQEVTVSSPKNILKVNPLPQPQPATFDGAVGNFSISASIGNNPVVANSNAGFTLVIEGSGNLQQVKAPVVPWPAGIESFEPVEEEQTDKTTSPVAVKKTIRYTFVVNKKGAYTIPPVPFCFFNGNTGEYETVHTNAQTFKARAGATLTFASNKLVSDFETRLYILLGAGVIAILVGLYLYNRKQTRSTLKPATNAEVKIDEPVNIVDTTQYIHALRELNPIDDSNFHKHLHNSLQAYLSAKFNIGENEIEEFLTAHSSEDDNLRQLRTLLDNCRIGMYTPVFDAEAAMQHRLKAMDLLMRIENQGLESTR